MEGEIELYNISFLILKVELHFNKWHDFLILINDLLILENHLLILINHLLILMNVEHSLKLINDFLILINERHLLFAEGVFTCEIMNTPYTCLG